MKYSCKKTDHQTWVLLRDGEPFFEHWREEFAMMTLYTYADNDEEAYFWEKVADERDLIRRL